MISSAIRPARAATVTHYNQGGLSANGPVWISRLFDGRNRLFWMFAFEDIQASSPNTAFLTGAEPAASGAETTSPAAIREQLDRILSSAQLLHSRRSQALLKFVVEKYLDGAQDTLKERLIGTEVFNRPPAYDTNQDSVVRTAAAETRKRPAQYYLEPGRERELRIGLPQGSYVPEFRPAVPGSVKFPVPLRAWRPAIRVWALAVPAAVLVAVGVVWG